MRNDPFAQCFIQFLEAHGIHDYSFGRGTKHPYLLVNHGGVTYLHAYPGSTGDHRATLNAVSDLKHRLGLIKVGRETKPDQPRRRRKARRPSDVATVTIRGAERSEVEDRYYARLEEIRQRLLAVEVPAQVGSPETTATPSKPGRHRLHCPFLGRRVRYQEAVQ
ncbi:MAG: hypothetical protein JWO33_2350 [Caulobacteraceae bacterium]|nr:hypothetical protein [Caulobacteraceae bacterium]